VLGIDTAELKVKRTVDLNATLVGTGLLGTGLTARPGLAHPRSIAITNNGNDVDDDESIYVTEYFGQRTAPESNASPGNAAGMDTNHDGIVYKVSAKDGAASAIRLGPIADIGFKDSATQTAGCFPNQLQSITIQGNFAYVSHICASPRGPTGGTTENFKTTTHGAVSVIDLSKGAEVKTGTASLHQKFEVLFGQRSTADANRRYPAVPSDIAFVKGASVGYVAANAIDAVFRVAYGATGEIGEVGATNSLFIDTNPAGIPAAGSGKNPIGVATANTDANKRFMFVANDVSRTVQVVDLNTQALAGGAATPVAAVTAAQPAAGSKEEKVLKGKRFFNTGAGPLVVPGPGLGRLPVVPHRRPTRQRHLVVRPRAAPVDVASTAASPRRTPNDQRIFNWTAIFDEVADFEGNTRGISGGVGAIVSKATSTPPSQRRPHRPRGGPAGAPQNHGGLNGSGHAGRRQGQPRSASPPRASSPTGRRSPST
jgi:hypothetical protein